MTSSATRILDASLLTALLLVAAASPTEAQPGRGVDPDGPAVFTVVGQQLHMTGSIFPSTAARFRSAIAGRPELQTLVLNNVPGSTDDDAALELYRAVRRRGLNTHLPADGVAVSGGVDLFCAGVRRTAEAGSLLLVHPWEDNQLGRGNQVPLTHSIHDFYRNYYAEMGIAEGFYEHTLFAPRTTIFRGNVGYVDLHNLSAADRRRFNVTNDHQQDPVPPSTTTTAVSLPQLVGVWDVTQASGTAQLTIKPNRTFTWVDRTATTTGTVSIHRRQVMLHADSGQQWPLTVQQVGPNRIQFATLLWTRRMEEEPAPQPPEEAFSLAGSWTEIRTDNRPQKTISIEGDRYYEISRDGVFTGTIECDGDRLTIRGMDGSVERFRVQPAAGGRVNFQDPQTGRMIRRFHWVRM